MCIFEICHGPNNWTGDKKATKKFTLHQKSYCNQSGDGFYGRMSKKRKYVRPISVGFDSRKQYEKFEKYCRSNGRSIASQTFLLISKLMEREAAK